MQPATKDQINEARPQEPRKPYKTPTVSDYGTVEEQTRSGFPGAGDESSS